MRVCGLMSGTSLDGLDIAVVDFSYEEGKVRHELIHFKTMPFDDGLREELHKLMDPAAPLQFVSSMNMYLGERYADSLKEALQEAGIGLETVDLISSHGQTIWHEPAVDLDRAFARPNTMQIGDIAVIAERTGKKVIGDFRTRDMAAGGQGAPLVPYADHVLFQSETAGRILLNIGGIANMTVLPPSGSEQPIIAYDTGPGNMVIDASVAKLTDGQRSFDQDGELAKDGTVDDEWLESLMGHDYFAAPTPKSTGRELFGTTYVDAFWAEGDERGRSAADKIATATMLTAKTIATEIERYIQSHEVKEVIASGGGVHNRTLMEFLQKLLPEKIRIVTTGHIGIDADAKEAFVFALLGYLGIHQKPNSLPAATGAERATIMGKIAYGL
ncbi:anhydro-N-acetylmuramic acid kinase [Sporosarcina sp. ACRSL]|uniref:anhydro-N-acetylmuramic acid kinase n=1 Tax=Sporosarcina sp. ACRSL TaxID=2918215 RepID=UPI001EF42B80|nr:anhydro-N-acetylmuramic acid kinase [Sporosarcina sp. ACRSL]MCG7344210.1 anhydro-N-acetylmuramic acid kinase [Sporosarcina sp. ACRSL]